MRLSKPRIEPLPEAQWTEEVRAAVEPARANVGRGTVPNILATIARHPKLLKRWNVFSNHVLFKSTLPARDREILILRVGWLCRSGYECRDYNLMKTHGGEDVLAPGATLDEGSPKFCAIAPTSI